MKNWWAERPNKQKVIIIAVGVIVLLAIIQSFTGAPTA